MFELLHDVLEDGVGHVADEEVLLQVRVGSDRSGFQEPEGAGAGSVVAGLLFGGLGTIFVSFREIGTAFWPQNGGFLGSHGAIWVSSGVIGN